MPEGNQFPKPPTSPMGPPAPNQQQQEELKKKLSGLFSREKPYTPLAKSLEAAGIKPRVMDIMLEDQPVECLVIPVQELIYKEWKHMTGGIDQSMAIMREGEADGNRSPEMG